MKNAGKRKLYKLILSAVLISAIAFVSAFLPIYSYTYWSKGVSETNKTSDTIVQIGAWELNPNIDSFTDFVAEIYNSDALLTSINTSGSISTIYVLGINDGLNPLVGPDYLGIYDVLVWQRYNGMIVAAQIVGPVESTMFSSWDTLENALTNPVYPLSSSSSYYTHGAVYTTAHAPINFNGKQFLARHNYVTTAPAIGDDWYLISNSWIEQSYPVGSFIEHNKKHYYKLVAKDATPGTNSLIWHEVPEFTDKQEIDQWYQKAWTEGSIVEHNGQYYYSSISANSGIPGVSANWKNFTQFDINNTVRTWQSGMSIANGDFVRVNNAESTLYYLITANSPAQTPGGYGWKLVNEFYDVTGIALWDPEILYGNEYIGLIVKYDDLIFEKTGWTARGVAPPDNPNSWKRILKWSGTQGPAKFTPGMYKLKSVFYSETETENSYYGVVNTSGAWVTSLESSDQWYQRILPWNPNTTYTAIATSWNMADRSYYCYTIDDEDGSVIFWTVKSGNVTGGLSPEESESWEKIIFTCEEDTVATMIGSNYVVWDINPDRDSSTPASMPSETNSDWIRRVISCSQEHVYTERDGIISLWQKTISDDTQQTPGESHMGEVHWNLIPYKTGLSYVYTFNNAGIMSFWYSPNQSNSIPSVEAEPTAGQADRRSWIKLNVNEWKLPEYVYKKDSSGKVTYFATESNPEYADWFDLSNAWIGNTDSMIYHWSPDATYRPGDIVVYGISKVNTYRYFVLRDDINSSDAVGHAPLPGNSICYYWEAVNVLL